MPTLFDAMCPMSDQRKILFENISSLYILQVTGYVIPLIILPFLVRKLGGEMYGLMVFAFSLIQYFVIFTDYGFNLSATRRISIHRGDRRRLSEIFSAVTAIKSCAMVVSFVVFIVIIATVKKYQQNYPVFLVSFLSVVANVLFPVWLFQGLEKIKQIAILTLVGRLLSLIALLLFIHSPRDIVLAVLIQSISALVPGIFAVIIIARDGLVEIVRPSRQSLREVLSDGWPIFVSLLSVSLFTNTGVFLLGSLCSYEAAGYFAIADKIIKALCGLSIPIVNGIYPRISALFASSQQAALGLLRKVLLWGGSLLSLACIALFIFAPYAVHIITGDHQSDVVALIRIMAITPLSIFIDNIYGTQILLNIKRERVFMMIIIFTGMFSLTGMLLFVPRYGAFATAVVFTLSELILLAMMYLAVKREGIKLL